MGIFEDMIRSIEAKHFHSLHLVRQTLDPFQVLVGANATAIREEGDF